MLYEVRTWVDVISYPLIRYDHQRDAIAMRQFLTATFPNKTFFIEEIPAD